jgi:hypothetical protein
VDSLMQAPATTKELRRVRHFSPYSIGAFEIGAVAGILFYLNALFPQSHLIPFVWIFGAGVIAVYFQSRASRPPPIWHEELALAAVVGIVAGVFFLLPGIGTLYAVGHALSTIQVAAPSMVLQAPMASSYSLSSVDETLIGNTLIISLIAIPATAAVGGGLMGRLMVALHNRSVAVR